MSSIHISQVRRWVLASPPVEWALNQLREMLIGALRQGPIPKHVAFVMDGNRRYAKSHRIETVEGHNLGFEALARILEVCYKSGVTHVTIYAFSIENFKRSKYEVDALMDMAMIKLKQMLQHGDILDRYGAKIRVLGQKELIKPDLRKAIEQAVKMTAKNDKAVLNVCFPYTSREEITTAIRDTVEEWTQPLPPPSLSPNPRRSPFREEHITNIIRAQEQQATDQSPSDDTGSHPLPPSPPTLLQPGTTLSPSSSSTSLHSTSTDSAHSPPSLSLSSTPTLHDPSTSPSPALLALKSTSTPAKAKANPNDQKQTYPSPETISATTLDSHMHTSQSPPLDLLIRTSGVERLSDFMLWQCHESTQIVFVKTLWPAFDLWQFLPVVWEWQWRVRKGEEKARRELEVRGGKGEGGSRVE